jgi:hypothetical protein
MTVRYERIVKISGKYYNTCWNFPAEGMIIAVLSIIES